LRRIFKGTQGKGITTIEIPSKEDPTKYTSLNTPSEMEDPLLDRNINHFGQAEGTPFTLDPLLSTYGYEGCNEFSTKLIDEGLIPDEMYEQPEYVKMILRKLSNGENLPKIESEITFEEFIAGFKSWKEKTTTSPSGRHLGHYKLLISLPIYETINRINTNLGIKILNVYYQIAMTTAAAGITLTRWSNISTIMIEKIKNNPRIDKLRVIHLFEADYNMFLKILWARKLVWNAHDNNRLNEGQAGSRPGRKSIDVILQKELKYLYSRLTKTALGTIDNDAKSCYDRIMCNVAMCVSKYYSMPNNLCYVQANTLKSSVFRIRTAIGDSIRTYQHNNTTPIHGTGQGSCASPAIWLLISSLLMDILQTKAKGMEIIDINNKTLLKQYIEGFVDDTSIFTNIEFTSQCVSTLVKHLEFDGTTWSGFLSATGGKLEIMKCFYYVMSWTWNDKGDACHQNIEQQGNFNQINLDPDNNNIKVLQREVTQSHKTLGAYKCMNGVEEDHLKEMIKKSKEMGFKAINGQMNRRQGRLAYRSRYIPAMLYSLPAMSYVENTTNSIQQPAIGKFLQVSGFEKNFPRAITYGAKEYGGLAMPQLYVESSCCKVQSIITHINSKTDLGTLIIIVLNWMLLCCGITENILNTRKQIHYIEQNWIFSVKEFLNTVNAAINIKGIWTPKNAE
jgi:Reverse transcriptase (RNA-dependent DNA polymerase)